LAVRTIVKSIFDAIVTQSVHVLYFTFVTNTVE
jgi:hypothetical protein